MKSIEEIQTKLAQIIKSQTDAEEFRDMKRTNLGYDLDRERVLNQLITVENEKRKLLLWILDQSKVGDK